MNTDVKKISFLYLIRISLLESALHYTLFFGE
jgi:hypothetical protein